LVRSYVASVQTASAKPLSDGIGYAVGMFMTAVVASFVQNGAMYTIQSTSIKLRSGLRAALFRKVERARLCVYMCCCMCVCAFVLVQQDTGVCVCVCVMCLFHLVVGEIYHFRLVCVCNASPFRTV
jgi:hypothetical protein